MRLCYLSTNYSSYLTAFYASRPKLASSPFVVQHKALLDDGFGWNGAWSEALPKVGYEVLEIVANAMPAQLQWARERGCSPPAFQQVPTIALMQLEEWKPDVVFLDNVIVFDGPFVAQLRSRCPSILTILGFSGSPALLESHAALATLRSYDVVLAPLHSMVAHYRELGGTSCYFAHAFNKKTLLQLPGREPVDEKLLFVGGIVRASGYHLIREKILETVAQHLPVQMYGPSSDINPFYDVLNTVARSSLYYSMRGLRYLGISVENLSRIPYVGRAALWNTSPMRQINPILQPHIKPSLFGGALYAAQRKHAITLNVHGDTVGDEVGNMRLFEVTGVGGCLLTDSKRNLSDFFEIDREVVTFSSPEECVEKARWLLDHSSERESIAEAGQRRTLRDHTFDQRAIELDSIIRKFEDQF